MKKCTYDFNVGPKENVQALMRYVLELEKRIDRLENKGKTVVTKLKDAAKDKADD